MRKRYAFAGPLFSLMLFCMTAAIAVALSRRVVTGTVTDPTGASIRKGEVAAISVRTTGTAAQIPWTAVDANGNFRLSLSPGTYVIRAKDEADGYPDPSYLLSRDSTAMFPTIVVDANDLAGIQVRLGEQGGVLQGSVLEQESHNPILGSKVVIRSANDSAAFVEITPDKNGMFQFCVPAKPIIVCAEASKHSRTCFEGGKPIRVSGGGHLAVGLQLRKR